MIKYGKVILNVDCDMYSNNSQSVRDSLCFLMDEEKGQVINEVELHGVDGYGGPLYIGSGCFHGRETLCGSKFSNDCRNEWKDDQNDQLIIEASKHELEEKSKQLASSTYEENNQWEKEGYQYSAKDGNQSISIQHGEGRIELGRQMAYCYYCLWAPNCLATLLLNHPFTLSPQRHFLVSTDWSNFCGLEAQSLVGGMIKGYGFTRGLVLPFAFIGNILKLVGFSDSAFVIKAKVADQNVSERYEEEVMKFGTTSPMLTPLATLALLNLFCFAGFIAAISKAGFRACETMVLQVVLCVVLVLLNWPLYQGLFFRKDNGKLPSSVARKSIAVALIACIFYTVLY
ncbi:Cellulose synthase [Quillaja saponaria]|uniref:Cellulose synthase n=1 Tax=Quillaja saponaria TaxID=32244 RepID=A0AAD7LN44_QUISA|nr:Cellulose synthase [Quillaja saponaria]